MNLKTAILAGSGMLGSLQSDAMAWQSDNEDGTYTNPPLYADYPDPDIIRVERDFYFVTTTFVNTPGIRILHSEDLVNWEIESHLVDKLDGRKEYDMEGGTAYKHGMYAASIRFHKGFFYVVVTPVRQKTRIYYAEKIKGPWQYHELDYEAFDPGFFIDDDGTGYIATSSCADGTVTMLTLNNDFSGVVDAREVYYNKGGEGSKIIKRGDYYYLFHSVPSRMALTCSRAKSLFGPWETVDQIDDTTGGHQGALVDMPDGSWYGFVMCDYGAIGRITNISPVFWKDDWPVWGTPGAPGRVPVVAEKPTKGKPVRVPSTSDDFDNPDLGLQWAWNHNSDESRWSLSERPGFLRMKPTRSNQFWTARNTLTQKGQGPRCRGEVKLDLSQLASGDICGFGTLGKINAHIAVRCGEEGRLSLEMNVINDKVYSLTRVSGLIVESSEIWLRTDMDFQQAEGLCAYSLDGKTWITLGGKFKLAFDWQTGTFQGEQFAIFCYNPNPGEGWVDVDYFKFSSQWSESTHPEKIGTADE